MKKQKITAKKPFVEFESLQVDSKQFTEVKVIKMYKDVYTGDVKEIGDVFTCTIERSEELLTAGVVEIICWKNSL